MDKGTIRGAIGAQIFNVEVKTRTGYAIAEFSPAGLNLDEVRQVLRPDSEKAQQRLTNHDAHVGTDAFVRPAWAKPRGILPCALRFASTFPIPLAATHLALASIPHLGVS